MTGPATIRYEFTVEDPSTWSRPWSGDYEMTRIDGPLIEYACHEGNYQLPSILKGARRGGGTGAAETLAAPLRDTICRARDGPIVRTCPSDACLIQGQDTEGVFSRPHHAGLG